MTERIAQAAVAAAALAAATLASATPSTVLWTPATTDTQAAGVPHLTYDTYFGEAGALQIDAGLTVGLVGMRYLQVEAGADLYFPTMTPDGQRGTLDFAQLNVRATLPENALGGWSPALSVGIANVGFRKDVSNYDTLHATLGKAIGGHRVAVGAYYGAGSSLLWTPMERQERWGATASWVSRAFDLGLRGLPAIDLRADLATGRNWLGGLGIGTGLIFTPAIRVVTGAVVFRDWDYYQRLGLPGWLWTVQLDLDVDLGRART
jgi:hypothetical protein